MNNLPPRTLIRDLYLLGWTRLSLAGELGVSHRTIEGWEQGRPPSAIALIHLTRLHKKETAQ